MIVSGSTFTTAFFRNLIHYYWHTKKIFQNIQLIIEILLIPAAELVIDSSDSFSVDGWLLAMLAIFTMLECSEKKKY